MSLRSFYFTPPLLQIPPLIKEVENISDYPGIFLRRSFPSISLAVSVTAVLEVVIIPSMFMSSSLRLISGDISHLLMLGICLPHLGFLTSQGQISVWIELAFWASLDELERSSSPSHGHFLCLLQENTMSYRH